MTNRLIVLALLLIVARMLYQRPTPPPDGFKMVILRLDDIEVDNADAIPQSA